VKSLLLLTEHDDCTDLAQLPLSEYAAVILAFWASPEFVARVKHAGAKACWRLNELVTDYAALADRAYRLAHDLIARVPLYRNVNPLLGSENTIANALLTPLIAAEILRGIRERGQADTLVFLSPSDTQRAFAWLTPTRVLSNTESTKRHAAGGRLGAWLQLVREARRDRDWAQVIWTPIEVLDRRYTVRQRVWRHATPPPRGGIVCYSSYINYSRTLAKHAVHFDAPPHWVINNHSAQLGLPANVRTHWLWQFGAIRNDLSIARELRVQVQATDGLPSRAILESDSQVRDVFDKVLPLALAEIDLMDALLDQTKPDAVWVANQWGSEAALIQLARAKKIPVTQVQHGVLEQYYHAAPIYSDRFLVWGEFWKRAINPAEQSKVVVVNPGFEISQSARTHSGETQPRVTFFTTPAPIALFWNPSVALWETVTLLDTLNARGHAVTVRVHPADRIEAYQHAWREHCGRLPARVSFEKGGSLEPVLAKTDVAMMAFSTVFLNCLASGIPIISTGWYPFMWQAQLQAGGYIHLADSLAQAQASVDLPLSAPPPNDLLADHL
jgi:hypothetical protein